MNWFPLIFIIICTISGVYYASSERTFTGIVITFFGAFAVTVVYIVAMCIVVFGFYATWHFAMTGV